MVLQRLLLGSLMIAALVGLVLLDGWLSSGVPVKAGGDIDFGQVAALLKCALPVTLLVVMLVILGTYELGRLCRAGGYKPVVQWAAFVGAGLAIVPWIEMQQRIGATETLLQADLPLTLVWLAGGLLGTCMAVLMRKTTEGAVGAMAVTLLAILYLGLLGSFVVRIRCLCPGPAGAALVVFYILTVKFGDIGAFFCGKLFGKHKLAPWLSPGKTIEGFFGAVLLSAAAAVGGMAAWGLIAETLCMPPLNIVQAIIFGIVMAFIGHLGDLVESAIKRDVGAKDSSTAVGAFGGLLDLVDSPLLAAPVAWGMLTFWGVMG